MTCYGLNFSGVEFTFEIHVTPQMVTMKVYTFYLKQSRNDKRNAYTARSRPTEGEAFTSSSRQCVALMLVSLQDDLC